MPIDGWNVAARAVRARAPIYLIDTETDPDYQTLGKAVTQARGVRSIVAVPMISQGSVVGTIAVSRREPGSFSDKEIALLQTFADQAVIAIENVRLFTELETSNRELTTALDTQTATSDILRVISCSQTDVQPVFDAIVISARRLLRGYSSGLTRVVGDQIELAALTSTDAGGDAALRARFPLSLQSDDPHAQAIRDRATFNAADFQVDPRVPEAWRVIGRARGWRSGAVVPMLRHEEVLGTIAVTRREPGGFADDEIALLQTFADQAVIAIENVRLFNETKEALEQQTATAEILRVISSSPTDVQPVFDAIAASAARVCGADDAIIVRVENGALHFVAHFGTVPLSVGAEVRPLTGRIVPGRAILERRTIHVPDLDEARDEYPDAVRGIRTLLVAPLVQESVAVGAIVMRRLEMKPFSDRQVKLLETFADQAVIAIENVRLFKELQTSNRDLTTALEQQTATS